MTSLFLVTGGAGFIGSNLAERLLTDGHRVRILDNFSTGKRANLGFVDRFSDRAEIIDGDIRDLATMERTAAGATAIFHQAALGSVPRSVEAPLDANDHNVTGTLIVFEAARRAGAARVVYASSSSVYGDRPELPKREGQPMAPISPYGVSKAVGEQYARVWNQHYGVETVGLRYFNVFGPRQDPASEYAAVIPRFILTALRGGALEVHGDGRQSRDFTFIDNVVEANIRAAGASEAPGEVFNVGCASTVTLLEIIERLEAILGHAVERRHTPSRAGDVPHSLADISKAARVLGYTPLVGLEQGLARTIEYFKGQLASG